MRWCGATVFVQAVGLLGCPQVTAPSTITHVVDRAVVDTALEDPAALRGSFEVDNRYEDGAPAGVEVVSLTPRSHVGHLGLRPGDVLQIVNGHAIRGAEGVLALFHELLTTGLVRVELRRNGQSRDLRIALR